MATDFLPSGMPLAFIDIEHPDVLEKKGEKGKGKKGERRKTPSLDQERQSPRARAEEKRGGGGREKQKVRRRYVISEILNSSAGPSTPIASSVIGEKGRSQNEPITFFVPNFQSCRHRPG